MAFLISVSGFAKERDCILIHLYNGSYIAFPVHQKPLITFEGNVMSITTEHYQVSNVRKYTFIDSEDTGIENVSESNQLSNFSFDGKNITLKLKDRSLPVRAYKVSGAELPLQKSSDENGDIQIDMSALGQDVILLTVGSETIKIKKQ